MVDVVKQQKLFDAIQTEGAERAVSLIDQALINARNADGHTPLLASCIKGKTDVAIALLKAGADPNIGDANDGSTPLMYAAGNLDTLLVKALIQYRADLDAVAYSMTAMHWAACAQVEDPYNKLDVIKILLQYHASVTRDEYGKDAGDYLASDDISFQEAFERMVGEYTSSSNSDI